MRFSDLENIWSVRLNLLSNADRGKVFFERAKQVVTTVIHSPVDLRKAFDGKHLRRQYLIARIGCSESAITQNPRIRALLSEVEVRLAASFDPLEAREASHSQTLGVPEKVKSRRAARTANAHFG